MNDTSAGVLFVRVGWAYPASEYGKGKTMDAKEAFQPGPGRRPCVPCHADLAVPRKCGFSSVKLLRRLPHRWGITWMWEDRVIQGPDPSDALERCRLLQPSVAVG